MDQESELRLLAPRLSSYVSCQSTIQSPRYWGHAVKEKGLASGLHDTHWLGRSKETKHILIKMERNILQVRNSTVRAHNSGEGDT